MYRDMVSLLSPAVNGDFAIEHFEITNHDIRAIFKGIMPGEICSPLSPWQCRYERHYDGKAHQQRILR